MPISIEVPGTELRFSEIIKQDDNKTEFKTTERAQTTHRDSLISERSSHNTISFANEKKKI